MHILSGRVDDAIELLNKHFPSVLAMSSSEPSEEAKPALPVQDYIAATSVDPSHLLLNLRILAFVEACRTVPLDYSPSRSSTPNAAPKRVFKCLDDENDPECLEQQTALLKSAQKLYALASMLEDTNHRARYLKELSNVSGLLAYKVPEESSMSKYLSQERREAVADQINSAILREILFLSTCQYFS